MGKARVTLCSGYYCIKLRTGLHGVKHRVQSLSPHKAEPIAACNLDFECIELALSLHGSKAKAA